MCSRCRLKNTTMATARKAGTAVPYWGIKTSMKAWLIKHWLNEAVKELSAYLKAGYIREARCMCKIAIEVNYQLWIHDVIWYDDYLEIEEMLKTIYRKLMEV